MVLFTKSFYFFYLLIISSLGGITINLIKNKYFITAGITGSILIFSYIMFIFGYWDKYFPFFKLEIKKPNTLLNKEVLMIILTILTLVATIIGGIVIPFIKN